MTNLKAWEAQLECFGDSWAPWNFFLGDHFSGVGASVGKFSLNADIFLKACLHEKIAPVRVSYWDDFLIFWWVTSYLWYLKGHFMLIHVHFKSQTLCIPYPFQSTCRPINTKTGGHFTFTWYRYEIFYLTPLQQRKWTYFGVTRTGMAFSGCITYFKTSVEPWKGTRVNSDRRESRPGVM